MGKAHARQGVQGLRVIIDPGEDQTAETGGQGFIIGEKLGIAGIDPAQHRLGGGVKSGQIRKSRQSGDPGAALVIFGQYVGLLVVQHLNAMLPAAQKSVGPVEFSQRIVAHLAREVERLQSVQRARRSKGGVAPPQDQLLGLGEEFDLTNAAAPQFQIGARRGQALVHLVGMNLALDGVDVGYGRIIKIAPPDKGLQLGQKSLARRAIARRHAGLDHGRPLPVLADGFVVIQGGGDRHGGRGRGRVRPKPKVHPEHIAVLGPRLEHFSQRPGQTQGQDLWLDPFGHRQLVGRIKD